MQKELDAALSFKDKFETASAKLTQSTSDLEAANKKLNTLISEKEKLNKSEKLTKQHVELEKLIDDKMLIPAR